MHTIDWYYDFQGKSISKEYYNNRICIVLRNLKLLNNKYIKFGNPRHSGETQRRNMIFIVQLNTPEKININSHTLLNYSF